MKVFRIVSILEGLSYLMILAVSFGVISREYVFPLGASHGFLFVLYLFLSLNVSHKHKWPVLLWVLIFLASLIPFAFVAVELFLSKENKKAEAAIMDIT